MAFITFSIIMKSRLQSYIHYFLWSYGIPIVVYFFGMGWIIPTLTKNGSINFFLTDNLYIIIVHITFTLVQGIMVLFDL